VHDYTIELVEGVDAERRRIDAILGEYSEGWTVDRMPDVDRAILRLSVYELLWRADVPDAVAIDEAVELAKSLSTDESPRFVNGVLGRIMRDRPSVEAVSVGHGLVESVPVEAVTVAHGPAESVAEPVSGARSQPQPQVESHAEPRA
jgi:transcription antitermination factor NusB